MTKAEITAEPGTTQIIITREFNAPPEQVLRAHTDPDLVTRWLGPRAYEMKLDQWDVRDGGSWRYIHRDDQGNEFGFHGVFHGEPSLDGFVQTFEFEGYPGHVSLDTATFENIGGGRTRLRANAVFQSVEDRDGMLESGMETGLSEGYERLDEVLAEITKR
jgi:uncharacterized protein YndB with AHSA1/START domain